MGIFHFDELKEKRFKSFGYNLAIIAENKVVQILQSGNSFYPRERIK